jgi:Fur family ferric uptake transcriptional regulator
MASESYKSFSHANDHSHSHDHANDHEHENGQDEQSTLSVLDPSGQKLTKGCKKVLEYLERAHDLSSAQDIHGLMRTEDNKAPGLTTVYRSLESLVGLGLVQAVDLGDGERRYELVRPGEHHHHLVCQVCKKSLHLDECIIEQFEDTIRNNYGFKVKSHILEIFGVCRECAAGIK